MRITSSLSEVRNRRIAVPQSCKIGARALLVALSILSLAVLVIGGGWGAASLLIYPAGWITDDYLAHGLIAITLYIGVSLVVAFGWESGHPVLRYLVSIPLTYALIGVVAVAGTGIISH